MILQNHQLVKTPQTAKARRGFTLVEIMIVVSIIVILAGVGVPLLIGQLNQAKYKRARADVQTLTQTVKLYYNEIGTWPQSLADLSNPQSGKTWIKRDALVDPWGNAYLSSLPTAPGPNMAQIGGEDPDIWAVGPDGAQIGNWLPAK